jgi:DNA-binding MarR family transcriptional regulator
VSQKTTATKSDQDGTRQGERPPEAWVRLLRAHATLTRRMDATLRELHGLSLNEFEVMLQLWLAEDGRLRRVDLAQHLVVTQGGITRLLAGLERQGLVERQSCDTDARVVYACLTSAGERKLVAACKTHLDDIRRLFSDRFSETELGQLATLLARLDEGGAGKTAARRPRAA